MTAPSNGFTTPLQPEAVEQAMLVEAPIAWEAAPKGVVGFAPVAQALARVIQNGVNAGPYQQGE